jgi:hypothetical protein
MRAEHHGTTRVSGDPVNNCHGQQKGDDGGDKRAVGKLDAVHEERATDLTAARHQLDQRIQERHAERYDQRCEGRPGDHTDRQIDHIATQDEIPESVDHLTSFSLGRMVPSTVPDG